MNFPVLLKTSDEWNGFVKKYALKFLFFFCLFYVDR